MLTSLAAMNTLHQNDLNFCDYLLPLLGGLEIPPPEDPEELLPEEEELVLLEGV